MVKQIFVNLPVKDLEKTKAFFGKLGFEFDQDFTNDKAACMILGENLYSMLLTEPFFKGFISKDICDAKKSTEVLIAITLESREAVDEMVQKAVEAGGRIPREPQDHGFMYQHSFEDLDGHIWEPFYMESNA